MAKLLTNKLLLKHCLFSLKMVENTSIKSHLGEFREEKLESKKSHFSLLANRVPMTLPT